MRKNDMILQHKNLLISFVLILLPLITISQENYHFYNDAKLRVNYSKSNNKLNGSYTSYYTNGKLRAFGSFKDNQRIGLWVVYDTLGNKIAQRQYVSNQSFEVIIGMKPLSSNFLTKTDENCFSYPFINEKDVQYSCRNWYFIPSFTIGNLDYSDSIFNVLKTNIRNNNIKMYDSTDENLQTPLSSESFFAKNDVGNYKIIGFNIMVDEVFYTPFLANISQVISIAPIVRDIKSGKEYTLFWVYFPEIRKYLAQIELKDESLHASNIDDLFFWNNYESILYKTENIMNQNISNYKSSANEIELERNRLEVKSIETEHDLWNKCEKLLYWER